LRSKEIAFGKFIPAFLGELPIDETSNQPLTMGEDPLNLGKIISGHPKEAGRGR
jgi:hypothetical protein